MFVQENKIINKLFFGFSIIYLLFHLISLIHGNILFWSTHFLVFLPPYYAIIWIAFFCLFSLPVFRNKISQIISLTGIILYKRKSDKYKIAILFSLLFGIIFFIFKLKVAFLGDGYGWLRTFTRSMDIGNEIVTARSPLAAFIVNNFFEITKDPFISFSYASISAGIIGVGLMYLISTEIGTKLEDHFVSFCMLIGSASTLLYFGYVEYYAWVLTGILAIIYCLLLYERSVLRMEVLAVVFGIASTLHNGILVYTPVVLALFIFTERTFKKRIVGVVTFLITFFIISYLSGYSVLNLIDSLLKQSYSSGSYFVPLSRVTATSQAYTFFSFQHALAIINLQLLVNPFGIILFIIISITIPIRKWLTKNNLIYLLLLFGSLFLLIGINCDIGASMDWDALSVYIVPIVVAGLIIFYRKSDNNWKSLILPCFLLLAHTILFIIINVSPDLAFQRALSLRDLKGMPQDGWFALTRNIQDYLSSNNEDPKKSLKYWNDYINFFPFDSKGYLQKASIYEAVGEIDSTITILSYAEKLPNPHPALYRRLGLYLAKKGDFENALPKLVEARKYLKNDSEVLYFIGAINYSNKKYSAAINSLEACISVAPEQDFARFLLASSYLSIGDTAKAIEHFIFLKNATSDKDLLSKSSIILKGLKSPGSK